MKEISKRAAAAALAGVMAAGLLTGCGEEEKVDGTQIVATVDGEEIPMGILSLAVRYNQAQTESMYISLMGGMDYSIWDTEAEEGKTYGEQAVEQTLDQIELMYIMRGKAADYDVTVTEEDQAAIAEAAASFMEANSEETLEELSVSEDQVKTYLELQTYLERMHDPMVADVDTDVPDEEAQQSSFTYVSISTADLSDEEIEDKKADAQEILDAMKEDPDADFNETASAVSEDYSALEGTFDTNVPDTEETDEEEMTSSSTYPDEVMEVLRTLNDGELGPDVIETDTAFYVVRLDQKIDEDATESKRESIISEREEELYTDTTQQWLDEADITVDEDVLKTLKLTDSHKFSIDTSASAETADTAEAETAEDTASETETDSAAAEDTAASDDTLSEDEVLVPVTEEELEAEGDSAEEDFAEEVTEEDTEDAAEDDTAADTAEDAAEDDTAAEADTSADTAE